LNTRRGAGCKSHIFTSTVYIFEHELLIRYNEALRRKEWTLALSTDELRRLTAPSVEQDLADVVSMSRLAEGGFNRTFVITLRDGQQVVAHVPYPMTVPK
jgi:hypothetical protein